MERRQIPMSWCALCTGFPALQFDLFVLTPDNPNHQFVPVDHAASVAPWAVYSVDLLAALYPPVYNELTDIVQPVACDLERWHADTLKSHCQFLKLQLYHYRVGELIFLNSDEGRHCSTGLGDLALVI